MSCLFFSVPPPPWKELGEGEEGDERKNSRILLSPAAAALQAPRSAPAPLAGGLLPRALVRFRKADTGAIPASLRASASLRSCERSAPEMRGAGGDVSSTTTAAARARASQSSGG